jgi:hypothetical protein
MRLRNPLEYEGKEKKDSNFESLSFGLINASNIVGIIDFFTV